jgi:hypothetical protein
MIAICPAGPPKLINQSFSQNIVASLKEGFLNKASFFMVLEKI